MHRHNWHYIDNYATEKILSCIHCHYARTQNQGWCSKFPMCRRKEITTYIPHVLCNRCSKIKVKIGKKNYYPKHLNAQKWISGKLILNCAPLQEIVLPETDYTQLHEVPSRRTGRRIQRTAAYQPDDQNQDQDMGPFPRKRRLRRQSRQQ